MDWIIAGIVGILIGWILRRLAEPPHDDGERHYNVITAPGPVHRLHYLGTLDERQVKRLANFILDGGKFNGPALERRHKRGGFLSPAEFEGVRDELIAHHFAEWDTRHWVSIRPTGYALFRLLANRRK